MGWYDYISEEKLDAIERQHISDEARLKAVVEAFLLGEGEYQPSWRMLIHRLHWAQQSHVAEKIKTNAEPQQGKWVSVWKLSLKWGGGGGGGGGGGKYSIMGPLL